MRRLEEEIHTVSVDEMTGIQALERIAATKLMKPGKSKSGSLNTAVMARNV